MLLNWQSTVPGIAEIMRSNHDHSEFRSSSGTKFAGFRVVAA